MAEPVKDNYLRTSEINILKEKLCVGLKPNAEPPRDRDELLRELIRLEHHFADVEKIQKDCFKAYNELKEQSDKNFDSAWAFSSLVLIVLGWLVAWYIDNFFSYILFVFYAAYWILYPTYDKSRTKILDESVKKRFSNLYKSAERNFIKPEDVFFLPKMRFMVETGEASDYASLMICLEKYLKLMNDYLVFNLNYINAMRDIESGRFRQRSVNSYDRWGFQNGGLYGKCSCGAYFDASGVCPNCGKSNRM